MISKLKRITFKTITIIAMPIFALIGRTIKIWHRRKKTKIGFLNIEFFHKECGPFGGYGKVAKNITDYFNSDSKPVEFEILLARPISKPSIKRFHGTNVLVSPDRDINKIFDVLKYGLLLNSRGIDFLMTIEYFPGYEYSIFFLPREPLMIWIHDPRTRKCLEEISTVSLELAACGENSINELERHIKYRKDSIARIIKFSKLFKRRIIFATTAFSLIEKAKEIYGLQHIEPVFLPIPVEMPDIKNITYSSKPSVCFLGRLDPIKRPWIFFELAKRFKDVDFIIAGKTHFPQLMNPIIDKYLSVPNLKFLGLVLDKDKDELLRNIWAIINTSIHEALPVSFIEALSYGKGIISCQNPDNIVEKFGVYTGELLGDGFDEHTLNVFSDALNTYLVNHEERIRKGVVARGCAVENYSYKRFESILHAIINK